MTDAPERTRRGPPTAPSFPNSAADRERDFREAEGYRPRVAVAIKQVPPSQGGATDPLKGFVLRTGPGRLNPHDGPAIEMALMLKDRYGALVDLFSMGPVQAETALKEALSLGPDRAFHLTDPLLAGADSLATARTLIRAMDLEGPYDIIVSGLMTSDGGTGQVGPAMAALMDFPFAGRVSEIVSLEDGALTVEQLYRDELLETRLNLPCLVTVHPDGFTPRLPTVRARLHPRLVNRLTASDLIAPNPDKATAQAALFGERGSPTKILRTHKPKANDKVLARPTPPVAASVIIEAALKAKS